MPARSTKRGPRQPRTKPKKIQEEEASIVREAMKDTLVQQEFNRITQLVQAAVNAAGQQHRSVDEKCIRDAYQLWRERALNSCGIIRRAKEVSDGTC